MAQQAILDYCTVTPVNPALTIFATVGLVWSLDHPRKIPICDADWEGNQKARMTYFELYHVRHRNYHRSEKKSLISGKGVIHYLIATA